MSSASMPPHGFATVRGRGYRPEQIDAFLEALSDDRDAAWERAARLTVLARDMEAEAVRAREEVAQLVPQTYEALGDGARRLFQRVREEAADLLERTRRAAQEQIAQAESRGDRVRRAAAEAAEAIRAEADEHARRRLVAAQAEADGIRAAARHDVKAERGQALAVLREARQLGTGALTELSGEQAERWAAAEREEAERMAALDAAHAERASRAEAALAEATRALAEAEEYGLRCQEAARARAVEIVAEARVREELIAQETERVLREHGDTWDDVQAHMDSVRDSLISLTGRVAME